MNKSEYVTYALIGAGALVAGYVIEQSGPVIGQGVSTAVVIAGLGVFAVLIAGAAAL